MRGAALPLFALVSIAIAACGGSPSAPVALPAAPARLAASKSPIEHVVIAIQENRSFDNLFATFPGADGATTGKAAPMPPSIAQNCSKPITQPTTVPLAQVSLVGSGSDLNHNHAAFTTAWDGGAMDGFDLEFAGGGGGGPPVCLYEYQYVNPNDIRPYWDIAKQYVLADRTFQTQASGSFTAHQDLIAGGTQINSNEALIDTPTYFPWGCDANPPVRTAIIKKSNGKVYRYGGPFPCLSYPTLRDLLDAKSVSWKFYAMPVQKESGCEHGNTAGLWSAFDAIKAVRYGPEWHANVTRSSLAIFDDVKKNRLPSVAWVTPDSLNSDHPGEREHQPCQSGGKYEDTGPSWIASLVNAIGESPYWKTTAIVIVWDDWGGFYDHVAPPEPRNWQGGPGFRVPMLIVSPYVKPHVEHTTYEFGSILRFVEQTWGLGSLGNNDADSKSIGNAFDFTMAPRKFKKIAAPYSREYLLHRQPSTDPPDTD
ncbi:MAG TPA: alkaline phosphatase family protein [Candidatus Binatia bacterium]|nr:alkaline phosphatase family protein [Candidatus Binatia bacterium]